MMTALRACIVAIGEQGRTFKAHQRRVAAERIAGNETLVSRPERCVI